MNRMNDERGIALAAAVFALVVIGGLVGGALFVGMQEQRIGRNSLTQIEAFGAADAGAQIQLAEWDKDVYNQLNPGDSLVFGGMLTGGAGWYRGSVRRMSDMIYFIRSEGFSRDSTARQQLGGLVRLKPIELNTQGAFTTVGGTRVGGSSIVSGADTRPLGWGTCDALEPPRAGVVIPDTTDVLAVGERPGFRLDTLPSDSVLTKVWGNPALMPDTMIDPSNILVFGDMTFDDLVELRSFTIGSGTYGPSPSYTGTECNRSDPDNWGDPLNPTAPCGNHFPIIHATGTVRATNGYGQGILLVDGDLTLAGNFQFFGPVIVRGSIGATGSGNTVSGAVVSSNTGARGNLVLGDSDIRYSSCALVKALAAVAPGAPMRERGWVQLY